MNGDAPGAGRTSSLGFTTRTTTELLHGLMRPDNRTVWKQFDDRYRPLLKNIAIRRGLAEADADDAAQITMTEFFRAYTDGKYTRAKGRLRHWLFGIARHQVANYSRKSPAKVASLNSTSGPDFLISQPDPVCDNQLDQIETCELERAVLEECIALARQQFDEKTVQAFELHGLKGLRAKEVGPILGLTENAVYVNTHKVSKRVEELAPIVRESFY